MADEQLADHIQKNEMDLVVDLAGHTSGNRLRALVSHPAPVQVTYLGYPNTTGLAAIDARLTEAVADPPGAERYYTERLVRLSEGFCCFTVPVDAPDVGPLPALHKGYVTLGSPHNLAKLNDRVLSVWAQILKRLPTARLRMFRGGLRGGVRDRLIQRFVDRGIAPERLELEDTSTESVGYAGYLAAVGKVDLVLDAFPANAGTTACEALAMGVPLVSLLGDRVYGRLSVSLLTRVGLSDWVAGSVEEYVELAVKHGSDVEGLSRVRGELRGRVKARLGEGRRFTRALEQAYRDLWKEWCRGETTP
jgi:predicted O-linked N-acetylglucosamine transferase (SPINDLY family)